MLPPLSNYDINEEAFHLKDALQATLDALVAVYQAYNVPLPERRYWSMGDVAIDCEQATVSFVNLYPGMPGDQAATPQRCNVPRTMVVTIQICRPTAVLRNSGAAPSAEAIQTAAEWPAVDAWVLADSLEQFDTWGGNGFGPGPGVIATIDSMAPEGGFQATRMQLSVVVP